MKATNKFPMEIASSLLITQEDMEYYNSTLKEQEKKRKELDEISERITASDGTLIKKGKPVLK